ncbi:hypothetical protein ACFV4M_29210 [Kitasatospora indigofera]|uniref:hypothetical protein n=1 Tax=Kitasatospora indigofera TaxID=67307 RepID=UPI00365531D2
MRDTTEPRMHARIEPPSEGDRLITANIGPHGELVALWSTPEAAAALTARRTGPGGATFALARPERPAAARLTRQAPHARGFEAVVDVPDLGLAHCQVQPLPGDRFLVVGARCTWTPAGAEPNARVIDSTGQVVAEAVLGDGIEHVATTPAGRTWVGYFDEGVFGNNGWGDPDLGGPEPVGAAGLVRFDERLERVWDYPGSTRFGHIYDCYALNVADESAWACFYDGFPVVRVAEDAVSGWTNKASGVRAVVTDGLRCALVGGYGADHDRVVTGLLTDRGRLDVRGTTRLALPGGPAATGYTVTGRGDVLHVLTGTAHLRLDLDQLFA